jgi:hypothetical protein
VIFATAAHPATDLRTVPDNYDTHQHLGIPGGWPGATAGPVRRRVSPRQFKPPGRRGYSAAGPADPDAQDDARGGQLSPYRARQQVQGCSSTQH